MFIRQLLEYRENNETRFYTDFDYDAEFVSTLKSSVAWPHRKWDPVKKMWSFSKYGLEMLRNIPGVIFYEDALNEVVDTSAYTLPEPCGLDQDINFDKFNRPETEYEQKLELWDFQKCGISRIVHMKTQGLFFEMGLGKTYTAICAAKELLDRGEITQCLIISTISVALDSWVHMLERMHYSYRIVMGSGKLRPGEFLTATEEFVLTLRTSCSEEKYHVPEVKTDTGRKCKNKPKSFVDIAIEKKDLMIIVDEIHKLSNTQSGGFKALLKISKACKYRTALTGTVMKSTPEKCLLPLRFLYPNVFSNKGSFEEAFTIKEPTRFGAKIVGYRNLDILKEILHRAGMFALKKNYLKDLPPILPPKLVYVETDKESIDLIEEMRNNNLFKNLLDVDHSLLQDLYIRVHQALVCPSVFGKNLLAKNRLQAVLDCLGNLDGKTVIFTTLKTAIKELYSYLTDAGIGCTCCSGDQSFDEIQKRTDKFVEDESCTVMLATIQKMGTGFDRLKVARNAIIYDHNTNADDIRQAIDRLHRSGQKNTVSVIHILQDNAVSHYQFERIQMQKKLMEDVEDDKKQYIESSLDLRQILKLVQDSSEFLRHKKEKR